MKKNIRRIIKSTIASISTIGILLSFNNGTVVAAKDTPSEFILDETFMPLRADIPNYIARYSGFKGDIIQKVWAKVFYEEYFWNTDVSKNPDYYFYDENYDAWYKKYNHGYDIAGNHIPLTYYGLNGEASLTQPITYSSGDFEAYFGNTIEANPEFMLRMLGLSDTDPLGNDTRGNDLMKNIIGTYLFHPEKYDSFFTISVAKSLQSQKDFFERYKEELKTINCTDAFSGQNIQADYCLLSTLASLYKVKDSAGNDILSEVEEKWVESYQLEFYDAYTLGNNPFLKAMVENSYNSTNKGLYELIARSTYASNNRNGFGQTFFDYVEASKQGAGQWINQIENVSIPQLNNYGSIADIFNFSSGYCHTHGTNCISKDSCKPIEAGGKATEIDELATLLNSQANPLVLTYVKSNPEVFVCYSNPADSDEAGWLERFQYRHSANVTKDNVSTITTTANIVSGGNASDSWSDDVVWEGVSGAVQCTGHGQINIKDIDKILSDTKPLGKTAKVQINFSRINTHAGYSAFSWSCSNPKVSLSAGGGSSWSAENYAVFDISKLTMEERKNCVINFSVSSGWSTNWQPDISTKNGSYGYHRYTASMSTSVSTSATATLFVKRSDCFENGHKYRGDVTWNKDENGEITSASIIYTCTSDANHTKVATIVRDDDLNNKFVIKKIKHEGYTEYSFLSPYVLADDNSYDSYSTKVFDKSGATSEYISLNAANTSGTIANSDYSSEKILPGGATSKYCYKAADCNIAYTILPGIIQPGVKSLTIGLSLYGELKPTTIIVYNYRGQVLATNDHGDTDLTVRLDGLADSQLKNSYVTVTTGSRTEVWTTSAYNLWQPIDDARTNITATGITLNY